MLVYVYYVYAAASFILLRCWSPVFNMLANFLHYVDEIDILIVSYHMIWVFYLLEEEYMNITKGLTYGLVGMLSSWLMVTYADESRPELRNGPAAAAVMSGQYDQLSPMLQERLSHERFAEMVERYETRKERVEARRERRAARRERASADVQRVLERLDMVYDNLRASQGQRAVRVYEMLVERLQVLADRTRDEETLALIEVLVADIQDEIDAYADADTDPVMDEIDALLEGAIDADDDSDNDDNDYDYDADSMLDDDDRRIDTASAPEAILEYVATYYPQAEVVLIEREEDDDEPYMYEVELSNRVELYFDANVDIVAIDDSDLYDDDDE